MHPRDEYNHFWSVHDKNYPFTLQSNNETDLFNNYIKYIKNLPYAPTFSQQSFEVCNTRVLISIISIMEKMLV